MVLFAIRALMAPFHEKQLRGYNLRIYPADSWHQPIENTDGRVHWKSRGEPRETKCCTNELDQNAGLYIIIYCKYKFSYVVVIVFMFWVIYFYFFYYVVFYVLHNLIHTSHK